MFESGWYQEAPWMFAIPLKTSRFVPLSPEDAIYNVETDLSAIKSFEGQSEPRKEELAFADYRTLMGFYLCRVGAGRSGYYRDAYLKGIGRTTLTFNWAHLNDRFFNTGHLPASGAARELVVSRYFKAKGKAHLINGARGMLVAELEPSLRDPARWLRDSELPALPCDTALQAITVKDPRFARFTNIIWHLNHLSIFKGEVDLIRFFSMLHMGLRPFDQGDPSDISPSRVAQLIATTIENTVRSHREYWQLGVGWISVQTDPTIDGRYHDIDLPLFYGSGYLAAIAKLEAYRPGSRQARFPFDINWHAIAGFSVLEYLHAMRLTIRYLKSTLKVYVSSEFHFSPPERDFIDSFVQALDEALPPDHVLWSGAACAKMLRSWIEEECEVVSLYRRTIDALVETAVASRLDASREATMQLLVEPVKLKPARAGSRVKFSDFVSIVGTKIRPERLEEAQFLNDLVAKLDNITDRDQFCAEAREAEKAIDRHCHG